MGSVVLKRLQDAQADQDPIFGVILGTNTNHCGQTDSITRPHEGDQASVFNRIIRYANIDPLDVGYIEMHGTGTQAGDATEMQSVLSVFAPDHRRTQPRTERSLYLGSAKANIGHAESASGVSSLIKVLMMMRHNKIPPHCGIKTRINHNYPKDLAQRGVHIAMEATPWHASSGKKRQAFLNNFSAAGGNTAVLLEDAPTRMPTHDVDPRASHIVVVSAKTAASLTGNIESMISFLEKTATRNILPQLSYTVTARRMHYKYRIATSGTDTAAILSDLKAGLRVCQATTNNIKPIPSAVHGKARVIFVFSGQGNVSFEPSRSLFDTNPSFTASILRLDRLVLASDFPSFLGLIDGSIADGEVRSCGPVVSHLALVCVQIAMVDLWTSWGISPAAVIGHSLGEYAALYAAGVLSAADVIYLVGTRATLLEAKCSAGTHSMLALQATLEVVNELLNQNCDENSYELACLNQPSGHVVSGSRQAIAELARTATLKGIKSTLLNIPYAFHSAQVDPILSEFEQLASDGATFHAPKVAYLSPLLACVIPVGDSETLNASYLRAASRNRVDFCGALRAAISVLCAGKQLTSDITHSFQWLEIGAHSVCSNMVKSTLGTQSQAVASLRQSMDAYKTLTAAVQSLFLAGIDVDWNTYHRAFPASHEVLDLPRYVWDQRNYWIDYRQNFCLTKGESTNPETAVKGLQQQAPLPKYLSPSAQSIIDEKHGLDHSSVTVESDLFDDRLLPVLRGHQVNDTALCPSVSLVIIPSGAPCSLPILSQVTNYIA